MNEQKNTSHNLFVYDSKKVNITGVKNLDSFDESGMTLTLSDGRILNVEGVGVTVTELDLDKGCVGAEGLSIDALFYGGEQRAKKSLFSKVFK